MSDLGKQVEQESLEIAKATSVVLSAAVQRCHFCGQLVGGGSEIFGPAHSEQFPQVRFKGSCCGG